MRQKREEKQLVEVVCRSKRYRDEVEGEVVCRSKRYRDEVEGEVEGEVVCRSKRYIDDRRRSRRRGSLQK